MEGGVTTFMHRIGTSYTNYFNIRLERSGRLFQGPFKAVRVESEGQFLCLNRYIHVNPLPAGLVTRERAWFSGSGLLYPLTWGIVKIARSAQKWSSVTLKTWMIISTLS